MSAFYKITVVLLTAAVSLTVFAKEKIYSDNDLKRILFLLKRPDNAPGYYVVLENIRGKTLDCKYLGTQQALKIHRKHVVPMIFYEDSSNFIITQYALWGIITGQQPNLALGLAKINNDTTGRITVLNSFVAAINSLQNNIAQVRNNYPHQSEEQADALADLINNDRVLAQVQRAATTNDWLLTIVLFDQYKENILKQYNHHFANMPDIIKEAQIKYSNCAGDLLSGFTAKMQQPNMRRNLFLQLYPQARGLWSQPPPNSYEQLKNILLRSMKSYHKLDNISKLFNPQDWGSAMLDVLLFLEGTPCAAELEKEFDDEMRRLVKHNQRH